MSVFDSLSYSGHQLLATQGEYWADVMSYIDLQCATLPNPPASPVCLDENSFHSNVSVLTLLLLDLMLFRGWCKFWGYISMVVVSCYCITSLVLTKSQKNKVLFVMPLAVHYLFKCIKWMCRHLRIVSKMKERLHDMRSLANIRA